LWQSLNGPVELSAGPFVIQKGDEALAKALQQGRQFALRACHGGPVQFVLDQVEGSDKAEPGGLTFHGESRLCHFQSDQVVSKSAPPNLLIYPVDGLAAQGQRHAEHGLLDSR
jgi:hypothetical protein